MSSRTSRLAMTICAVVASCAVTARAQAPDNTGKNVRDRQPTAKTADQQSNAKADVETTQRIRKAIVADKSLSTNAHNVKVITRDGKVTLKGPVQTAAEKQTVEAKAAEIAGAANVTNELSVTGGTTTSGSKNPRKPAGTPKEQ
jgi:hyperosmotically inducible periplasmic protein